MGGAPSNWLVIESSPADAYLTSEALKQAGLTSEIIVIQDGEAALRHLETAAAPDMILLDLNLEILSGLDLLGKIRANPRLAAIPVLMLSGSENAKDIQESYRHGANGYIKKPGNLEGVLRNMKILCEFWGSVATLPQAVPVVPAASAGTQSIDGKVK